MPERTSGDPLSHQMLVDTYCINPKFWAVHFAQKGATENITYTDGKTELVPSEAQSTHILNETVHLVLDMSLSPSVAVEQNTVTNLIERGRISEDSEEDFATLSGEEYASVIKALKDNAADKLDALTDFLILNGELVAVPLAFLTGKTDQIFADPYVNYVENEEAKEWQTTRLEKAEDAYFFRNEFENRAQLLRKARKLITNGGRIILPARTNIGYLQGFIEPTNEGMTARIAFGPLPPHIESRLVSIPELRYDKKNVLATLHPTEIVQPD